MKDWTAIDRDAILASQEATFRACTELYGKFNVICEQAKREYDECDAESRERTRRVVHVVQCATLRAMLENLPTDFDDLQTLYDAQLDVCRKIANITEVGRG